MTFQALAYLTAIFGAGCGVLAVLLTWAFNAALHWREEAGAWESHARAAERDVSFWRDKCRDLARGNKADAPRF